MYDYVLQYGFDNNTEKYIQKIKQYIKANNIKDKERNWLPHITIDLYNCNNKNEFIYKVDDIISKIEEFSIQCKNLNDFDKETLYIEPYNKQRLNELKNIFDNELSSYRLENRIKRIYKPHITLCTNNDINADIYKIANEKFEPFIARIKYIWIYSQDMTLIKQYE